MGGDVRLQKILAEAGVASRRRAEEWIRSGRVRVNGEVAGLGDKADPERDEVLLDGQPLPAEPLEYWILHKPRGALTTTRDPHAGRQGRSTVLDLLPAEARRVRLFPVGRLDLHSEGLLLLTNDGATAHALLHPSLGNEREYRVTVRGRVSSSTARRLARGPLLDDGPMAPCRVEGLEYEARPRLTTFQLTLREGRKRQIRRAMRQLGHPVVQLVRTRVGPLQLGHLAPGQARRLNARELAALGRLSGVRKTRAGGAASKARRTASSSRRPSK